MGKGNKELKFKMGHEMLKEVYQVFQYYHNNLEEPQTGAGWLAIEHFNNMFKKLHRAYILEEGVSISMSLPECVWFYVFWNITDTSAWPLANVHFLSMIEKINKTIEIPEYAKVKR